MIKENLVALMQASIKNNWFAPAFSDYKGETVSYGQTGQNILYWHLVFEKSGLKSGDKIALIGRNSANWALIYLATISYGAVIVPILQDFSSDDMEHLINHSDSRLLFADARIIDRLNLKRLNRLEAVISLPDMTCLTSAKKSMAKYQEQARRELEKKYPGGLTVDRFSLPVIDNSALSAIVYTSGTTGFSKGVMLPLRSLSVNVVFALHHFDLKAGDTMLSILPLAHAFGCAFEFLFPFCAGVHITFLNQVPTPRILLAGLQEVRPKLFLTVPLILEKIYSNQIKPQISKGLIKMVWKVGKARHMIGSRIRAKLIATFGGDLNEVVVGGAGLNREVEEFFKEIGFPITIGYGMTECGPLISYTNWRGHRFSSVGQIIDYLEVKIDSENPYQTPGEILVRGENVMTGYYKNKEATQAAIDADGWLHTGDMGVIDKDNFIYIRGRKKTMLLGPSGQNIYPEEIEAKLNNLPFVQESLVLQKNGKLVALVYPDYEAADRENVAVENLDGIMEANRKRLNDSLPQFSKVSQLKLYPKEFEKTPTKKVKRFLYDI